MSIAKGTVLGHRSTRVQHYGAPAGEDDDEATPRVHVARQATRTAALAKVAVMPGAARHVKGLTVDDRVALALPRGKADVAAYWKARKRRVCVTPDCNTPLPINAPKRIARCEECRVAQRATCAARRDARRAAGLCITCPDGKERPAVKGGRCEECRTKIRKTSSANNSRNATREARDAAGCCIGCGGPRVGDVHKRCQTCRDDAAEKAKVRREEMAKEGRCRCGRKAVGKGLRCKKCRAMRRARDAERKEELHEDQDGAEQDGHPVDLAG